MVGATVEAYQAMTRRFVVPCRHGVHMRVAARIVTVATSFQSTIWFSSRTRSANAKSILGLLELGLTEGEAVTVTVRGRMLSRP